MKIIDSIKRKIIDFKCHVSEWEIDDYIDAHAYSTPSVRDIFEPNDYKKTDQKIDRERIRIILSERKRRALYNDALYDVIKKEPETIFFDDSKKVRKILTPPSKTINKKTPQYSNFREAYFGEFGNERDVIVWIDRTLNQYIANHRLAGVNCKSVLEDFSKALAKRKNKNQFQKDAKEVVDSLLNVINSNIKEVNSRNEKKFSESIKKLKLPPTKVEIKKKTNDNKGRKKVASR